MHWYAGQPVLPAEWLDVVWRIGDERVDVGGWQAVRDDNGSWGYLVFGYGVDG